MYRPFNISSEKLKGRHHLEDNNEKIILKQILKTWCEGGDYICLGQDVDLRAGS